MTHARIGGARSHSCWWRYDAILRKYRTGTEFTDRTPAQEKQLRGYIDTMYTLRDLGTLSSCDEAGSQDNQTIVT